MTKSRQLLETARLGAAAALAVGAVTGYLFRPPDLGLSAQLGPRLAFSAASAGAAHTQDATPSAGIVLLKGGGSSPPQVVAREPGAGRPARSSSRRSEPPSPDETSGSVEQADGPPAVSAETAGVEDQTPPWAEEARPAASVETDE